MHIFHNWDKWRETGRRECRRGYPWTSWEDQKYAGFIVHMERECRGCGEKQFKTKEHIVS